jgi:ABC-type sugar transport system ATPase subunit
MPTMNFIEGGVEADGAARSFRTDGLEHPLSPAVPAELAGRRVVLGVRAEHVLVGDGAPLAGTAQLTEPLGDATLVHFDDGHGRDLVAKLGPTAAIQPGAPLSFRFASEFCHLFDAVDGTRVF